MVGTRFPGEGFFPIRVELNGYPISDEHLSPCPSRLKQFRNFSTKSRNQETHGNALGTTSKKSDGSSKTQQGLSCGAGQKNNRPSVLSPKYEVLCCDQNGPPARREEGACLNRYVTDEQRRRRPIFIATLWAGGSWLFFGVALSPRISKIWVFVRAWKNSQLTSGKVSLISRTGH